MELWLIALLGLTAAAGIGILVCRGKQKGPLKNLVIFLLAVILVGALVYGLLTFILVNRADDPSAEAPEETTVSASGGTETTAPVPETTCPEPSSAPTVPETSAPMPEDFDLPADQVPSAIPDLLNVGTIPYEAHPYIESTNDLALYFLNRFLAGETKLDFYLSRELAQNEAEATMNMEQALKGAAAYYLFHAYERYTMCIEEIGENDRVLAHLELRFINPDYDREARAEALEYVLKHPVPAGGFQNSTEEQAYAQEIHDYLIRRIVYDPIGYNTDLMLLPPFEGKQEAYNVLAQDAEQAVCAGFARGFALICHYAGIECVYVNGNENPETGESHAWNVLYPCDSGEPVIVDVTWDNTDFFFENGGEEILYTHFYVPLSLDNSHFPYPEIQSFLDYVHTGVS